MDTRTDWRWRAFLVGLVGCALLSVPGSAAAAKPRVVVKPNPGQEITRHPVRLVVRAGPEITDLKARLNGVAVNRDFLVKSRKRRMLIASNSHGLRHGRNVLKVAAQTLHGTRVRRAKVRFTVAHRLPLAGAGRDHRVVRGSKTELTGRVREHARGPSGDRVRWKIVKAPRGSRLRPRSPSKTAKPTPRDLRAATSLTPTFKPDVLGKYTLEMTSGSGAKSTTDLVDLYSVTDNPLVEVHTHVRGGPDDEAKRPAIQVDNHTYLAPFMARVDGIGYYAEPTQSPNIEPSYFALFQALILNRTTLKLKSTRTYGWCVSPDNSREYTCRMNDAGNPVEVAMGEELSNDGAGSLVIISSLPAVGSEEWAQDELSDVAFKNLTTIGFPDGSDPIFKDRLLTSGVGNISVIGVPGLHPGEAELSLSGGMDGWLTPDRNSPEHYGFMPAARVPFDTRSVVGPTCDGAECIVAQTVGKDTQTKTQLAEGSGFMVSVYAQFGELDHEVSEFFTTNHSAGIGGEAEVERMAEFLKEWAFNQGPPNVVVITSVHGSAAPPLLAGSTAATWQKLATQVAGLGGTLHRFHTAGGTPNTDYTLIGSGGAGEGHGVEAIGANARIRGALVPDKRTEFSPVNVSDSGAPPEELMKIILQAPGKLAWPGEEGAVWTDSSGNPYQGNNTPGTRAAIEYIGDSVTELGPEPRDQYWLKGLTMDTGTVAGKVDGVLLANYKGQTPISKQEFADAQLTLKTELGWVGTVKDYMGNLSEPSVTAANELWLTKDGVADTLAKSLTDLNHEAEAQIDLIEGVFGIVANLVDLGSVAAAVKDFENAENALLATAAVFELADESVAVTWDGSSATNDPDELRVTSDEIAQKVSDYLKADAKSFESFFHIIVSDYDKLQQVGLHGNCAIGAPLCAPPYDEFAFSDDYKDELDALAALTQKRMIYMHLLPYAYPVWDTGLAYSCFEATCTPDAGPPIPVSPESGQTTFGCSEEDTRPFVGAPRKAYFSGIEELDAGHNTWRTWLSVAKSGQKYGWADKSVYEAMFDPVDENDLTHSATLGIDPLDFMMAAHESLPFVTKQQCNWSPGP